MNTKPNTPTAGEAPEAPRETKQERRQRRLTEHYNRCETLARFLGHEAPNGKKISVALFHLENEAHAAATAQCNGESYAGQPYRDEDEWEAFKEKIRFNVSEVLGDEPPGFFINGDPRGYALKISPQSPKGKDIIDTLRLHRDWGGYGILSPEINGEA